MIWYDMIKIFEEDTPVTKGAFRGGPQINMDNVQKKN